MSDLQVNLRIYRDGTDLAYRRGFDDGQHAQAMDDAELVAAVGRWVLDQEILGREVAATMRATVADMRALNYRRQRGRG